MLSDCSAYCSILTERMLIMASSKRNKNYSEKIEIIESDSKYPLIPLMRIDIVERPQEGDESTKIFFNPRGLSSFTTDRMERLQYSIRSDGLQQPPIVRAIMDKDGSSILKIELIAGERRLRSCCSIYDGNLPCFDDDAKHPESYESGETIIYKGRFGIVHEQKEDIVTVDFLGEHIGSQERKYCDFIDCLPTVVGSKIYEHIPCKVVYSCTDQRALRLAFTENDQSEPLKISEEVALVERLELTGLKQEEIAEILGSNVTWVSQTKNFREQLPKGAFQKLMSGDMARHVAVAFLSYTLKDRDALYAASVEAEEAETSKKIKTHRQEKDRLEDEEDVFMADAKKAERQGNNSMAIKSKRKATAAANKACRASERLERAKKEKGTIKQGHLKQGAIEKKLSPKKAKSLDKDDIEATFVDGIVPYLDGEQIDEISGQNVPVEYAAIVRRTALAIISGIRDPLYPIREFMYEHGEWISPDEKNDEDENEIKGNKSNKKGRKSKVNKETMDFESDLDEDDEDIDNSMDNDEFKKQFLHDLE